MVILTEDTMKKIKENKRRQNKLSKKVKRRKPREIKRIQKKAYENQKKKMI